MQNYEILDLIYQSKHTSIHKVRCNKDLNIYAMKEYLGLSNIAINEIKIQKSCQCAFVTKIKEIFQYGSSVIMVYEYCDSGNLKQFISEHQGSMITERVICQILIQITYVLIYMRENKILYKGLSPENILIHKDQIRINDFGIDNLVQCLKPAYQPPEFIQSRTYTYKSVMWQLGLILYELTNQRQFLKFDQPDSIISHIDNGGALVKIPNQYSRQLRFLINVCLEINEIDRLDIRQFLQNESYYRYLLNQKHFTFTHDQQEQFEFWSNHRVTKQKRSSIITPNQDFLPQQWDKPILKELSFGEQQRKIKKLRLPLHTAQTQRPESQKTRSTISFARSNFVLSSHTHRKIQQPEIHKISNNSFIPKQKYLPDPEKPHNSINNLIKQKLEQCVDTIGLEETRIHLDKFKSGQSVKEFLMKYPDHKHQQIARHMIDIVQFTQI